MLVLSASMSMKGAVSVSTSCTTEFGLSMRVPLSRSSLLLRVVMSTPLPKTTQPAPFSLLSQRGKVPL